MSSAATYLHPVRKADAASVPRSVGAPSRSALPAPGLCARRKRRRAPPLRWASGRHVPGSRAGNARLGPAGLLVVIASSLRQSKLADLTDGVRDRITNLADALIDRLPERLTRFVRHLFDQERNDSAGTYYHCSERKLSNARTQSE